MLRLSTDAVEEGCKLSSAWNRSSESQLRLKPSKSNTTQQLCIMADKCKQLVKPPVFAACCLESEKLSVGISENKFFQFNWLLKILEIFVLISSSFSQLCYGLLIQYPSGSQGKVRDEWEQLREMEETTNLVLLW